LNYIIQKFLKTFLYNDLQRTYPNKLGKTMHQTQPVT